MNSCDFSSDSYNYVQENDKELKTFNIQQQKYKPDDKMGSKTIGKILNFISVRGLPPAWMKDNNDMLQWREAQKNTINLGLIIT